MSGWQTEQKAVRSERLHGRFNHRVKKTKFDKDKDKEVVFFTLCFNSVVLGTSVVCACAQMLFERQTTKICTCLTIYSSSACNKLLFQTLIVFIKFVSLFLSYIVIIWPFGQKIFSLNFSNYSEGKNVLRKITSKDYHNNNTKSWGIVQTIKRKYSLNKPQSGYID